MSTPTRMRHQVLRVHAFPVHYVDAGEGPRTVLLIHGGGSDHALVSWREAIPALSQQFRVLAPDLPGYGRTPFVPTSRYLAFCSELLVDFLEALGLPSVSVAGISMGGAVALGMTLQNPERVTRLLLVASYGLGKKVPFQRVGYLGMRIPGLHPFLRWLLQRWPPIVRWGLRNIIHNPEKITPQLVEEMHQAIRLTGDAPGWRAFLLQELGWREVRTCFLEQLSRVRQPVLLIHGQNDRLIPLAHSQQAVNRFPNAQLVTFPDCGHWPQREYPEKFHALAMKFFSEDGEFSSP